MEDKMDSLIKFMFKLEQVSEMVYNLTEEAVNLLDLLQESQDFFEGVKLERTIRK